MTLINDSAYFKKLSFRSEVNGSNQVTLSKRPCKMKEREATQNGNREFKSFEKRKKVRERLNRKGEESWEGFIKCKEENS